MDIRPRSGGHELDHRSGFGQLVQGHTFQRTLHMNIRTVGLSLNSVEVFDAQGRQWNCIA